MKIFTNCILLSLAFFVCLSCGQNETKASAKPAKKEMTKAQKEMKANPKGMPKKAPNQGGYWANLGSELKIDEQKLNSMRKLNEKNNEKIQALRDSAPADLSEQVNEIRIKEKNKVKTILGEELFQKKVEWDIAWVAARAPKTKPKK